MNELPKPEARETSLLQADVETRISAASARSQMLRRATAAIAALWVCGAVIVISRVRKEQVKVEQTRAAEQAKLEDALKTNEDEKQRLAKQAVNSRLASSYVASGVFKASHGDGNGALADYSKALQYDPDNSAALSYAGYLRLRIGQKQGKEDQIQKSEELLARAVQIDPNQVWHRYNYALALWANGKHQEAISQVREVLRLDPTFKLVIAGDSQFNDFKSDPTFKALLRD